MKRQISAMFLPKKETKVVDALKRCPVFRNLSDKQVKRLSRKCYIRNYAEGETIFYANEPAYGLFIVLSGEVEIMKAKKSLCVYSPVSSFGEFALLKDATRAADAIATKPTVLCYLFKESLKQLFYSDPKMCMSIYQNLLSAVVDTLKHEGK